MNDKKLRILFMGTPQFAVHILDRLIREEYTVIGVVTAPDKPSGRGQKVHQSAVKQYAEKQGLPVYQPKNLKSEVFENQLKKLNPDVIVVVAFRMLPESVWRFPQRGTFNLHASLLPDYRGAAPINWAIINGESKTGVTTFFLDHQIDTGDIIAQEEVAIAYSDTAGTLHDKLMIKGAELVVHTLQLIGSGTVKKIKQKSASSLKEAPKFDRDNTRIDWTQKAEEIYNFIRGLSPYPVAWTVLQNGADSLSCKIFEAVPQVASHAFETGTLIHEKKTLKVAVKDGFVIIKEMQLPGKRRLKIDQLLNGFTPEKNAKMA